MSAVEDWLKDLSKPAPAPDDLAAWMAHEEGVSRFAGGGARAALLRMAHLLVTMDGFLKEAYHHNQNMWHAVQDSSRTAVLALERLQQQDGLVKAAIAARRAQIAENWAEAKAQSQLIAHEAEKLRVAEEKRS